MGFESVLLRAARMSLELERPHTRDKLKIKLASAAEIFRTSIYLLGIRRVGETDKSTAITNFPPMWQARYDERDYRMIDPYLRHAVGSWAPFKWSDVKLRDQKEIDYTRDLAGHGMGDGIMCVFPTSDNKHIGALMFASGAPVSRGNWEEESVALHLLCSAFTRALLVIKLKEDAPAAAPASPQPEVTLTPMERNCVELMAQGKSAEETGTELNITASTVRYHIDQVTGKLNARNPRDAITEAIARGLARKRHSGPPTFKEIH